MDRYRFASPTFDRAQDAAPAVDGPPDSQAARWYVGDQKKKHGPLPWSRVVSLVLRGEIAPDVMLFKEGSRRWVRASTLRSVFGLQAPGAAEPEPVRPRFADAARASAPSDAPPFDVAEEPADFPPGPDLSFGWSTDVNAAAEPPAIPPAEPEPATATESLFESATATESLFESATAPTGLPDLPAVSEESPPAETEGTAPVVTPAAEVPPPSSWPTRLFTAVGVAVVLAASILLGVFVVDWVGPPESQARDRGEIVGEPNGQK
jgi:hypothetical protein